MKTSVLFALLPLLAVACAAPPESSETSAAADSADLDPTKAGEPSFGLPMGTFHLRDNPSDTLNLTIAQDGTFVWNIDGCDYGGAECGSWSENAKDSFVNSSITLQNGGADFDWVNDTSFAAKTRALEVTKHADGSITISGTVDGKPMKQEWDPGIDCIRCFNSPPACFAPDKSWCN